MQNPGNGQSDSNFLIFADIAVLDLLAQKRDSGRAETIERAAAIVWDSLTWLGRHVLARELTRKGYTSHQERQAFTTYVFEDLLQNPGGPLSYAPTGSTTPDKRVFEAEYRPYFQWSPDWYPRKRNGWYRY